jgi:hypothetical protein
MKKDLANFLSLSVPALRRAAFFSLLAFLVLYGTGAHAQTDTVFVSSDISPNEGNLNIAVQTTLNQGTLSITVFKLESNGYYVLTDSIVVPEDEQRTIIAREPGQTQPMYPVCTRIALCLKILRMQKWMFF